MLSVWMLPCYVQRSQQKWALNSEHWTVNSRHTYYKNGCWKLYGIHRIKKKKNKKNSEVFDFKKIGTAKEPQTQQQRMNNVSYGSI